MRTTTGWSSSPTAREQPEAIQSSEAATRALPAAAERSQALPWAAALASSRRWSSRSSCGLSCGGRASAAPGAPPRPPGSVGIGVGLAVGFAAAAAAAYKEYTADEYALIREMNVSRVARQDASGSTGFVSEGSERRVAFTVPADQPMHSFTFAFAFRCSTDCIGASVASVSQAPVAPQSARAAVSAPHPLPVAPPSDLKIGIDASGQLSTTDERSGIVAAAGPSLTDGDWHYVAVSHYYANASTNYYVDGQIVLQTLERRVPSDFVLACSSSAAPSCEYRDMLIYRSASNGDEVAFLADDTRPTVLQASLEVYAPLTNSSHLAANLAQSLSEVILNGGSRARSEPRTAVPVSPQMEPHAARRGGSGSSPAHI